jgi:hypothetical protein
VKPGFHVPLNHVLDFLEHKQVGSLDGSTQGVVGVAVSQAASDEVLVQSRPALNRPKHAVRFEDDISATFIHGSGDLIALIRI